MFDSAAMFLSGSQKHFSLTVFEFDSAEMFLSGSQKSFSLTVFEFDSVGVFYYRVKFLENLSSYIEPE